MNLGLIKIPFGTNCLEKRKRVHGYRVTQIAWFWVMENEIGFVEHAYKWNNYIFWWNKILNIKSTVTQNYSKYAHFKI